MLMLSNPNAMILMTDFEKAGGGGEERDQKRFLELLRAKAKQLKTSQNSTCLIFMDTFKGLSILKSS